MERLKFILKIASICVLLCIVFVTPVFYFIGSLTLEQSLMNGFAWGLGCAIGTIYVNMFFDKL